MRDNSKTQDLGFGNSLDLPDLRQYGILYVAVQAYQRYGIGAARRCAAAQRERGNIDTQPPEGAAHVPDYARLVVIAQEKDGSLQLAFERDAVDRQHPRRA